MDMGTIEERKAVRAACEALKTLNKRLEECAELNVRCRLEPQGSGYLADFTKTTTIYPVLAADGTIGHD